MEQAGEIAPAEEACPGAATELVALARKEPFHVLKDKARQTRLEAEQHRDLGARQRAARCARSHLDELGMVNIHLALEPHVGTPIVARAEAEAARLAGHKGHGGIGKWIKGALRGPSRRCLCLAAGGLGQGTGAAPRARRAGEPRGRQARLERGA